MNRRTFNQILVGAGLGSLSAPSLLSAAPNAAQSSSATAPFKISIMLWTVFRHLSFEQRLEKVSEAGFHAVELVGEFKNWTDADYRRFNRKKRQLGIVFDTTAGLKHGVADPNEREAFLKEFRSMLPICDKLECPHIIVLSGNRVPGLTHEQMHDSCIEGLNRAADIIKGKNLKIFVENIDPEENPKYFLTSVAEGFEVMKAVDNPQVRFLYDFYHEQIAEGNLIEKLEKNIDLVGLCHIADVPHRHQPGTGEINYNNIYKTLARLNYGRYIAMEFLPDGNAVEVLRTAREHASHLKANCTGPLSV